MPKFDVLKAMAGRKIIWVRNGLRNVIAKTPQLKLYKKTTIISLVKFNITRKTSSNVAGMIWTNTWVSDSVKNGTETAETDFGNNRNRR